MTEEEWGTSNDVGGMWVFLTSATVEHRTRWQGWMTARRFSLSRRKGRLFSCACCRRIESLLPAEEYRQLLEAVEREAAGEADEAELERILTEAERLAVVLEAERRHLSWGNDQFEAAEAILVLARHYTLAETEAVLNRARRAPALSGGDATAAFEARLREEEARQADLLREVIGNPFRPVQIERDILEWDSRQVIRLAAGIDTERAFERMPILGDALEDAGCTNEEVLRHCRQGGGHVRGCWVLDVALGLG